MLQPQLRSRSAVASAHLAAEPYLFGHHPSVGRIAQLGRRVAGVVDVVDAFGEKGVAFGRDEPPDVFKLLGMKKAGGLSAHAGPAAETIARLRAAGRQPEGE